MPICASEILDSIADCWMIDEESGAKVRIRDIPEIGIDSEIIRTCNAYKRLPDEAKKLLGITTHNSNGTKKGNEKMAYCTVKKVEVYNDRVVKVTFTDGSFTKATCSENDKFDIDVGITICLIKKMMGGSKAYNKEMKRIHKLMDDAEEKKKKDEEAKKIEKAKRTKAIAKKERKYEQWKEEQIEIQKEAYIRAIKEMETCGYEA